MVTKSATLEKLEKSKEELDTALNKGESESDNLNKAFDAALEDLGKSTKTPPVVEEDDDDADDNAAADDVEDEDEGSEEVDEREEEEVEDTPPETQKSKKKPKGKKELSKGQSVAAELTPEAKKVMNIEPFLKSLVDAIDKKFEKIHKAIVMTKSVVNDVAEVQEKQTNFFLSQGEMVKSIHSDLETFGSTPQPRKSAIRLQERFQKGKEDAPEYTRDEALEFLGKATEKGLLKSFQIAKAESRLSKGQRLPEDIEQVLLKSKKDDE